jgi:hypothetical protein
MASSRESRLLEGLKLIGSVFTQAVYYDVHDVYSAARDVPNGRFRSDPPEVASRRSRALAAGSQYVGIFDIAMAVTRRDLHRLVDELPESAVDAAARLLERERDPMVAVLDAAPLDDEPLTDGDLRAIEAVREEPGEAWEQARKELLAD